MVSQGHAGCKTDRTVRIAGLRALRDVVVVEYLEGLPKEGIAKLKIVNCALVTTGELEATQINHHLHSP